MATVTIVDPVTRIEGHMKVQVTIDTVNGKQQVTDAQCTGTQFRGFEKILVGRDTKDAAYVTQRICGVCPVSHAVAASMALENASGVTIPTNARVLRNLVLGANFIQSHILHFYLLAALDYITPPASAPWTPVWNVDLMRSSSMSQIATNFVTAVAMRREAHEMAAIFAGRMPGLSAITAGGFTTKPTSTMISKFSGYLNTLINFINNNYVPDVQLLSNVYSDYLQIGKGPGNLIAYGVFDLDSTTNPKKLLKRGVVYSTNPTSVQTLSTISITESVTNAWYDNSTNNLNPSKGQTRSGGSGHQDRGLFVDEGSALQQQVVRSRSAGAHVGQRRLSQGNLGDGSPHGARAGDAEGGQRDARLDQPADSGRIGIYPGHRALQQGRRLG